VTIFLQIPLADSAYSHPAAVLVSPEEFEGWQETLLVSADADLMQEIRKGLADVRKTKKLYTLEELFR
jgi:PHD/YefM family antitoxin component YafN of YafNO toxin-antitoxin module